MKLALCQPPPPLAEYIDLLWWYAGPPPAHSAERMLPTGAMQLVINLGADETLVGHGPEPTFARLGSAVLGGAYAEPFVIPTAQQTVCVGVVFRPGGASPFLGGLPADDLQNAHVSLDNLWGTTADQLVVRLREAATPTAGFGDLAQTLQGQIRRPPALHPAVAAALYKLRGGGYCGSIAGLASEVGVSQQRLSRLFRDYVGLTPKQLARVWRFHAVLRLLRAGQASGWADRAVACGYFDQSHIIRDFHAFTGCTPAAYLARWGARDNHLPLDS